MEVAVIRFIRGFLLHYLRDHAQIATTKVVTFGLRNPSVSVSCNGERTRPGSLAHVIHDRSYWGHILVDQSEEG